jgi:hypothetical protein
MLPDLRSRSDMASGIALSIHAIVADPEGSLVWMFFDWVLGISATDGSGFGR